MEGNFQKEHEQAYPGKNIGRGGYPDMGCGRYSEKLSYKDWFNFNSRQRVHYNMLENLTQIVACTLIAGLGFAWPTIVLAALVLIGRLVYTIG